MKPSTELSKWIKRCVVLINDITMTVFSLLNAVWLCSSYQVQIFSLASITTLTFTQTLIFIVCGLYRGIWRFASIPDLIRILRATLIGTSILFCYFHFTQTLMPLKTCVAYELILLTLLSSPRLVYRWFCDYRKKIKKGKRVLVVGAGSAGEGLMRDLRRSFVNTNFLPVAFVDDNPAKLGCEIHGVRVIGTCKDISSISTKLKIDLILIAIPSASSARMREIVKYCEQSNVTFRTLPNIKDIADGIVNINSLREVLLEDLLGREQVQLDWQSIRNAISDKIILVTGGGGSIGSELCRQIIQLNPKQLIIVDKNEFNLYSISNELHEKTHTIDIRSHLCCVTDSIELKKIFSCYQPNFVFHVAAYKHVPLLETHLRVSMHNNIIGTKHVAELSVIHHVKTFVLISTDKAVNPTNIMGATKRVSEMLCQYYNLYSSTQFLTVRFGNVLNSSGSVIPLFRKQLIEGGPLTVTHPEISRYFMTIPEASQLILQATTMNQQGEIFVLDMGSPINIRYLAEQMIKLSGKAIGKDIQIQYIGLRPGEKLHEELFHHNEDICETSHSKIKRAKVRPYDWSNFIEIINQIEYGCIENNEIALKKLLNDLVPEYVKNSENTFTKSKIASGRSDLAEPA